jgi:hypothetical protein
VFRLYYRWLISGIVSRGTCALPKAELQEVCDQLNKEFNYIAHWVETAEWFARPGDIVKLPNEHIPPETWKLN